VLKLPLANEIVACAEGINIERAMAEKPIIIANFLSLGFNWRSD
jgi:hypothetical protein